VSCRSVDDKKVDGSPKFKTQAFFAVYDSSEYFDYYGYDTLADAVAEVKRWIGRGLVEERNDDYGAVWGRVYVCCVDADTVPTEYTDGWSLWDYEDSAINYRRIYSWWGNHGMADISR
jgi:hypothetical protein